jgi:hypothetical protein
MPPTQLPFSFLSGHGFSGFGFYKRFLAVLAFKTILTVRFLKSG